MKINVLFIALLALVGAASVNKAEAITIDAFEGNQMSISPSIPPLTDFSFLANGMTIGGIRKIYVNNNTPLNGAITARTIAGRFTHSQDAGVSGSSRIVWDGTSNQTQLFPSGLAGINLVEDAGTALRLDINSLDLPSATLIITFYDAVDPLGQTRSSTQVNLAGPISGQSIAVPFSNFTVAGPSGHADLRTIGAIEIITSGQPDLDLSLNALVTNGFCPLAPVVGGKVLDECGVCGGDNSTCSDCAGVPNGSSVVDQCGVCGGDNSTCFDCAGVPNGTAVLDRCNVCNGDGTSCLGCDVKDLTPLLTALDGGAKEQEHLIRAVLKQVDASTKDKKVRLRTAKIRKVVHELQIRNWILSWQIPRYLNECTNEVFCASVSTEPKVSEYRIHSEELRKYMETSVKLLRTVRKKKGKTYFQKYILKANEQHANNMALADTVPERHMTCG